MHHLQQRRGSVLDRRGSVPNRRGSVMGALPSSGQRVRDKLQLIIPLEQTLRTIADIYQKKAKDDQMADLKRAPRCPMPMFVRD